MNGTSLYQTIDSVTEDESSKRSNRKQDKTTLCSRKRKRKTETVGRNFVCEKCHVAYLSYPALYTHNRNKHSMIPITSKKKFFKSSLTSRTKFKYSQEENINDLKPLINKLIKSYTEIFQKYTSNPQSSFFRNDANIHNDYIFKKLYTSYSIFSSMKEEYISSHCSIGEVIIMYIIMMSKITKDDSMIQLLLFFAFLLKEYLELFGWDYHDRMKQLGIQNNIQKQCSYYEMFNCDDLPDIINDFATTFLLVDDEVAKLQKEIMDVCHNFSIWLYSSKLTSFHLVRAIE